MLDAIIPSTQPGNVEYGPVFGTTFLIGPMLFKAEHPWLVTLAFSSSRHEGRSFEDFLAIQPQEYEGT